MEMEVLERGAGGIGITLDEERKEKFLIYERLITEWNRRMNLVRVRERIDLYRSHFLDSLWCVKGIDFRNGMRMVDIGSGAGFPGIPLKICYPGIELVLLEAQGKRCSFLREAVEKMELDGCRVVNGRAEEKAHGRDYRETFDAVVIRALSTLPVLMELGLPFLKKDGRLVALKGRDIDREIASSLHACKVLGGELWNRIPYRLKEDEERNVVVYVKVGSTPPSYPRRSGIPQKRPLIPAKEKRLF